MRTCALRTQDKYDYLIVFKKISKVRATDVADEESGPMGAADMFGFGKTADEDARVHWGETPQWGLVASEVWHDASPGDAGARARGVEGLKAAWSNATRQQTVAGDTSVAWPQFLNISREHIVTLLTKQ